MSKRKPILLISTKFPNHIVFFSNHKLANSNHTKPINNLKKKKKKKEEDIFNPKKGTFGEGEPGDKIIAEFVAHWIPHQQERTRNIPSLNINRPSADKALQGSPPTSIGETFSAKK